MKSAQHLTLITKERIKQLAFGKDDVLSDDEMKKIRTNRLKRAEQLGNAYKSKAKILFKSIEGVFKVETTVWATTKKHVSLKGGVFIPIHCIQGVDFY